MSRRPATVEGLTVRATTLRDFNGYLHFVPNGLMRIVVGFAVAAVRLGAMNDIRIHPAPAVSAASRPAESS